MRFRNAVLVIALTGMPLAATAQPIEGLYVDVGGGLHAPQGPRVTPLTGGFGVGRRVTLDEDLGFNANAAVGYGLGTGFRFEIEGDFSRSNLRHLIGTPFSTVSNGGHVRNWGVMANAVYDLDIGFPWIFPYLGVGAGYQWTSLNTVNATQVGGPFRFAVNNRHSAFAGQTIVGASFPIPDVPGLSATLDYRFMDILGGAKFQGTEVLTAGGPTLPSSLKLHNQFNHDLVVGVRYAFDVPAPAAAPAEPAPVAAPAPAPARSYLVFFDWDKANLTGRAQAIIKAAAENSTRVQYTRIEVDGYADTSGRPQYNQNLSVRRAQAVAGELVRDGVPQSAIDIQGFGETHLMVATGSNVREPQNRRVEIIIH